LSQNIFGDIGLKTKKKGAKAEALIPIKEILFSHTISSKLSSILALLWLL
jgi:hypothetical protein